MAPGCSKTDHDPANSTAVTITTSLPFQGFVSAIPSGRQKEPIYLEIWQPAMRLQYNSGFNTFLRCLAVFAMLPDPARPTSHVTAHNPALGFPPHPILLQAGKWARTAHNTAEHQRAPGKITHISPQRAVWACAEFSMWNLPVIKSVLLSKLVSDMRQSHPWLKPDN